MFFCSFIYVKHEQRYKCVTVSLATGLQNNFVNHGNFMSLNEICIRRQFFQMTFQVTASATIKRRVFVYHMRMQPPGKLYHRESGGNSERSRWRAHENASKFPFVCHKQNSENNHRKQTTWVLSSCRALSISKHR